MSPFYILLQMVSNILLPDHVADAFVSPEDPELPVSLVSGWDIGIGEYQHSSPPETNHSLGHIYFPLEYLLLLLSKKENHP